MGERQWIAVLPGSGPVLLTSGDRPVLELLIERRALLPVVIDALEAELRSGGFRERIALRWSTPDTVPVPLR